MIKKSLIYFVVLFGIYNLILLFWSPKHISSQGFWQDNQIVAQDYLYTHDYDSVENIIVGSSMSFRLATDSLKDFHNLAILGGNYTKGLHLIQKKGVYPKRVFIEINFPTVISDGDPLFDVLYNPVLYPLRSVFPAMRDGKQPMLSVSSNLEYLAVEKVIDEKDRDKYTAIFQRLVEPTPGVGIFSGFTEEISSSNMDEIVKELDEAIADLRRHGTEVVFFEMPVYKTLYHSPFVGSIRKAFNERFPADKYIHFPSPGYDEYQTLDGLHLSKQEALVFTRQFGARVDSLISLGK